MKPRDKDIAYCIEHREWLAELLEKRGGWQEGDWFILQETGSILLTDSWWLYDHSLKRDSEDRVWLPSVDDALEMLEARGCTPQLLSLKLKSLGGNIMRWLATDAVIMVPDVKECHGTPLIALLELLQEVKG